MPKITLTNINKRWAGFYAVDNLDLVIEDKAFITLLGPSGCGKTTTLRMIAGLETPTTGRITFDDQVVFDSEAGINLPANKRHVGFLFQNYALWPHMTVYKNILFGLQNVNQEMPLHASEYERCVKVAEALGKVEAIRKSIALAVDKKGKTSEDKALLNLIDNLLISQYSAKEIRALHLEEGTVEEAKAKAEKAAATYRAKAEEELAKIKGKGFEVNENYDLTKDGVVVEKTRRLDKEEMDLKLRYVARVVKIGEFMDRYPSELSGGQQQRVAIARTLAPGPKILFMDEPLSNLDAKLRLEMRAELKRLHAETGATFIYVTHDQLEAMTLATRICLINNGVLQQYDPPLTVYKNPANLFVADFVGNPAINFIEVKAAQKGSNLSLTGLDGNLACEFVPNEAFSLEGEIAQRKAEEEAEKAALAERQSERGYVEKANNDKAFNYHISKVEDTVELEEEVVVQDDDFVLGIRPEFFREDPNGDIEAEVYAALPAGMETTIRLKIGDYILTGVVFGGVDYPLGSKIRLSVVGKEILLFDRTSGKLVSTGSLSFAGK